MTKEFEDVIRFNKEVIGLKPTETLNRERLSWFTNVINEELTEFTAANKKYVEALEAAEKTGIPIDEDHVYEMKADMIDAILDLIYFAYGRLFEIGTSVEDFECMWDAIQNANMAKKRGNKGRGSNDDAIKPEGWVGPEEAYIKFKKAQKGFDKQLDTSIQTAAAKNEQTNFLDTLFPKTTNKLKNIQTALSGEAKSALDSLKTELYKSYEASINSKVYGTRTGRIPSKSEGIKYDQDKPNLSLVLGGFAKALKDVGYVGTFGAKKYSPNGWKTVANLQERYMSALLRHTFAVLEGDIYNDETGRHNLAHVAWNALALLEDSFNNIEYNTYNTEALAKSKATLKKI